MLFQQKKLPEIINLTRFLKSFWILYVDQIIVYNTFYSKLTFYIIKDRCQMHALKVFRSPVWLLLHKLYSPHYGYIRKMQRDYRLPLTQLVSTRVILVVLSICNSISENLFLELLENVDKVLFGVNVTCNCSTVDKKVLLLPIH